MGDYKKDVTLNEKDSLQDLLNAEKALVKLYATCISEGTSKGYREMLLKLFSESEKTQLRVFLLMTERGYYRVQAENEEVLKGIKDNFKPVLHQLY